MRVTMAGEEGKEEGEGRGKEEWKRVQRKDREKEDGEKKG